MKRSNLARSQRPQSSSAPAFDLEGLENRRLLSVSIDDAGWTTVGPSSDTRVVYVSSSTGSDTNSGLSESAAVASVAKAKSLVRAGMPDHLLLKRGDVWTESFGTWNKSGRSASEPMLIGTYGTAAARPTLRTGTVNGFDTNGAAVSHFVMQGIAFHAHTRDPGFTSSYSSAVNNGLRFVGSSAGALIEDCSFDSYASNVSIDDWNGSLNNIRFHRNVVTDAWSVDKAQGLYADGVNGLTLEENIFDHNGWNPAATGGEPDIYSHNIYLNTLNTNVVVKDNVISNAASHGLQARAGGQITGNLFLRNPIHMSFGHVNGSPAKAGGVFGAIDGNVFLESRDINGSKRGWAIEIGNTKAGGNTAIRNNVIASDTQSASAAIRFDVGSGVTNASETVGINDVTVEKNIVYRWFRSIGTHDAFVNGGTGQYAYNDVIVRNNDFQMALDSKHITHTHAFSAADSQWSGNRYSDDSSTSGWFQLQYATTSLDSWRSKVEPTAINEQAKYVDPTRSIDSYMASLGGPASMDSFLEAARGQSVSSWRQVLTASDAVAYVRGGFADSATVPTPEPVLDTTAPTAVFSSTAITTDGSTTHSFTVTYRDDVAIDAATLDGNDVKVMLPNGTAVAASLESVSDSTDPASRAATYRINAPGGTWDSTDNGSYSVMLQDREVADTAQNYAAAANLGTFSVSIPQPEPEPQPDPNPIPSDSIPPTVLDASLDRSGTRLVIRFSEAVSPSFDVHDIILRDRRGEGSPINPADMAMAYDSASHTAVITFPGLSDNALSGGRYMMTLLAQGISDGSGNLLDGNRDGTGGDDYSREFRVK